MARIPLQGHQPTLLAVTMARRYRIAYSQQPPDTLQISAPANKVTYNQCVMNYVKESSSPENTGIAYRGMTKVLKLQNQPLILLCRWNLIADDWQCYGTEKNSLWF